MDSVFTQSALANVVLAVVYMGYKVTHRCLTSRCRYTRDDGFAFDLDGDEDSPCPVADMQKIAEMIQARSKLHTMRHNPI
jgi:hypothetical protein